MRAQRPWAWPLVPAYRAASALESALYRVGLRATRSLKWPVVSVGSLSAGGAGKTPLVIALATMLRERGWQVDVLSRGYGREGNKVERVDDSGDTKRFGDEPVLIAERTSVPVWVGADRFAAGARAEETTKKPASMRRAWRDKAARDAVRAAATESMDPAQFAELSLSLHLLDDGFQHRQLARDFDLVLVTAEDLDDTLLPAGNLREPLAALRRADAIVIREEEREAVEGRVREHNERAPLWSIRRTLRFPAPLGVFSAGLRPVAFCGIARPEGFADMLADAGCGVVETVAFRDHHKFTLADADRVTRVARKLQATGLLTTEKDAVKFSPEIRERLEQVGPLAVVALEAEFVYKAPVMRTLEKRLVPKELPDAQDTSNAGEARLR